MEKLKIAVYAICKNEAKFIDRWMDSIEEADMVVVTDTGSTDDSVAKLESRGAIVYRVEINPWRFDVARNMALNFVPDDVDVCIMLDMDEVFEPGWREKIEKIWTPKTNRLQYVFTWSFNRDGSRGITFLAEKIHSRRGYRWVGAVHEHLKFYGPNLEVYAKEESIRINHYPDQTKSRGQYLPLLELTVKEDPNHDRNMHYLGREYIYYNMWDKCIETLKKHLSMPSATWKDERCASMRFIAKAYKEKGDRREAKNWLYKAIAEAPHLREPYIEMAQFAYKEQDWPTVYHMAEETLKIQDRTLSYLNQPFAWNETIYDLGAISCYYLEMYHKSYEWAKNALEINPNDVRLQSNLKIIKLKVE
ncbi:glycosyltransferase (plasmid) [Peribacillus frigoritolerans]|uniref:tetratricopeptide repeat-containing glycosyltransferase n=1 Tax=Peribacillus frigoritolerans TaxID=450367 RepID=UPI001EFDD6BB|nr:glycosyltransferase [Peribacillus frigoritolerans]ULM99892.1 glycosyltransferase [Peribacillus frigoritolerans]